ncbi:MAG: DUF4139 domain-containing protein [Gemmatimonadetes bacterium]|nr:DUF4139 domain-containing protein [Gemmatimonadota bacterium]
MKRYLAPVAGVGIMVAAQPALSNEIHVTVYNDDLALVKEVRSAEIPSGVGEFSFTGVPQRIDPTTVRLEAGKGLTVLEQNYRYDLVSRDKLLERYLDQTARIVTKHDKLHEGVLKTAAGSIVLETRDGVVLLNNDEIADITLPEIPEGLITRPTLVWTLNNKGATKRDLNLAYLTGGLSWHAEYVAAVDSKDERMSLTGWVSIENQSGATYRDAHLKVVAGNVNRVQDAPPMPKYAMARQMDMMEAADGGFQERAFFEYHLYDLGRQTTLADREVKQIQLLEDRTVPVEKVYVYEPTRGNTKVQVKLDFENAEKNQLGVPLPAGKVRVYRQDSDGSLEFAGEDRIDHTPKDEKVSLLLGNAFDLVGERNELEQKRITDRVFEQKIEIKLRNRKDKGTVSIIVREHPAGDWTVLENSHPFEKKNAHDLEFKVPVKAGEEVVLTYRVRSQY